VQESVLITAIVMKSALQGSSVLEEDVMEVVAVPILLAVTISWA
jgi:hypothetical protein